MAIGIHIKFDMSFLTVVENILTVIINYSFLL